MKKVIADYRVVDNSPLTPACSLLRLTPVDGRRVPAVDAGQFVQVRIDGSKTTFLRRPISICNVDVASNELWLLVRLAGEGTAALLSASPGEIINMIMPLGNGFTIPDSDGRFLLVGGGVGVAPLYMLGRKLKSAGFTPEFLLGARSVADLMLVDKFQALGPVHLATDDGSEGVHGVVTDHPVMAQRWDRVYCCGPAPMMKAVARAAHASGSDCEVSLENMMACGLGACLCCVEKTVRGNVCVCTEGPVFNISSLTWI